LIFIVVSSRAISPPDQLTRPDPQFFLPFPFNPKHVAHDLHLAMAVLMRVNQKRRMAKK